MNLAMPQNQYNPDTFRIKANTPTVNGDDITKRVTLVDTLHPNKEQKLLFEKVEMQEEYYPFGAPGAGAPLRNPENNNLVSRLPNINENLWKRYTKEVNTSPPENMEVKKREIHNLIDNYTQQKPNIFDSTYNPNNSNQNTNSNSKNVGRYDPKTRSHIKPENYWNDWFGKPGAGAPNYVYHKQNLEQMLEPRRSKEYLNTIHRYEPSLTPTSKVTISSSYYDVPSNSLNLGLGTRPAEFKRLRSDHHNRYELTPR